ncbi:NAD(P)H-dependent oxidoreductase subunit E [bacterium]|nr:NAD(P)H-dependent oxidoreductase subunit E [bacterium]
MSFSISDEGMKRVESLKQKYPRIQSAVMPILFLVQEEHGHISDEAIDWVSEQVDITPAHVMELVTFYTMYRREKLGKYHIQVCRTLSCGLCGAKKLMEYLHERLQVEPREVSEDGLFSYEHVECLGSCGTAPMCEINDTYFENLTPEKLGEVMDRLAKELPDLDYSTKRDDMAESPKGFTKSQVLG